MLLQCNDKIQMAVQENYYLANIKPSEYAKYFTKVPKKHDKFYCYLALDYVEY